MIEERVEKKKVFKPKLKDLEIIKATFKPIETPEGKVFALTMRIGVKGLRYRLRLDTFLEEETFSNEILLDHFFDLCKKAFLEELEKGVDVDELDRYYSDHEI